MARIAVLFADVLREEPTARRAREEIGELVGRFPPYPG